MKNGKIKVLFYIERLAGGGAERTFINIINNINKDIFEPLIVLNNNNGDYNPNFEDNIKMFYLGVERSRQAILKLRKIIVEENPDLMFSTINQNNLVLLIAKLISFKKIPTIVREASNRTESGKVTLLNKITTRMLYNNIANRIISLSEGVKNDLINNFNVKGDKIQVIYNPIEVDKIEEFSKEPVSDLNIDREFKKIIAIARLDEQKNYPLLLKSFQLVRKEIKSKLLILGKGHLEFELKQLVNELDITEDVLFLGFKENPYKYLKESDLFVLSSSWEGFGHVIVEAMATGTPVISTDCKSGPKEIIGDNDFGLLVPVNDYIIMSESILKVLNSEELRKNMSVKGKQRSRDFLASDIGKQYEIEFLKVLRGELYEK